MILIIERTLKLWSQLNKRTFTSKIFITKYFMESKKTIDLMMCGLCIRLSQMECEVDYIKLLIENTFLKELLTLVTDTDDGDVQETMELLMSHNKMLEFFHSIEISKIKSFLLMLYPISEDVCFFKVIDKMIEVIDSQKPLRTFI